MQFIVPLKSRDVNATVPRVGSHALFHSASAVSDQPSAFSQQETTQSQTVRCCGHESGPRTISHGVSHLWLTADG